MPLFTKKPVVLTVEERILQANELSANALGVFRKAADDLEVAAVLKDEVSAELDGQASALRLEAYELEEQSDVLLDQADGDREAAEKIRSFFG